MTKENSSRKSRRRRNRTRKDRLIQTRVEEDLERALKREAERRNLTVSHLIRHTLEDAFNLVNHVTTDVEHIVSNSVEIAAAVRRDARRFASIVRGDAEAARDSVEEEKRQGDSNGRADAPPPEGGAIAPIDNVYAWNRAIANQTATCASCGLEIKRGEDALVGLSDVPGPRAWLCKQCAKELQI